MECITVTVMEGSHDENYYCGVRVGVGVGVSRLVKAYTNTEVTGDVKEAVTKQSAFTLSEV